MNLLTILLQQMGGGSNTSFFVMMILIFVIMYFFMIRPQNKKQKEIQNFRKNLEVGQKVVTAGGIYGQIKDVQEQTVVLEIANSVRITVDKNSIFATAPDQTAAK